MIMPSKMEFYRVVSGAGLVIDDVKLVNCAGCSKELLGESMAAFYAGLSPGQKDLCLEPIYRRIAGRPYCKECVEI